MNSIKGSLAVIGLGYVGLPLAVLAAEKGWEVIGVDINKVKVKAVNAGEATIGDKKLSVALKKFPIKATTDFSAVAKTDVVVVAVPTPVTSDYLPDLRPLIDALISLRPHLAAGQVLVIESTINPGVMDEVVLPTLAERVDLPLDVKNEIKSLHITHCPERVNPGDVKWEVRNIPRVLGGYSKTGLAKAAKFYESILDAPIIIMDSITEAEAVKILENTFRDVNIAFINEMAKSFDKLGIDITNVIRGAATKPFAFMPHYPGSGVGGHCISVDPYYMIERAKQVGFDHEFLKLARSINDSMPRYTVKLMEDSLKAAGLKVKNTKIALLGLAYKKNIDDVRESPAVEIMQQLRQEGYDVTAYDPYVSKGSDVRSLSEAVQDSDVIILATDHDEFVKKLTPEFLADHGIKLIVDGRNALKADAIVNAGIIYQGIGRRRVVKKVKALV